MESSSESLRKFTPVSFLMKTGLYRNILLSSVFINLFVLAIPLFTMNVYDRVLPDFDEDTLMALTVGVSIALCFDFLLKMIRSGCLNSLGRSLSIEQDNKAMSQFLDMPPSFSISTGQKFALFQELNNVRAFWTTRLLPVLFDAPFFLIFVGIIYLLSPALATLPIMGAVILISVGLIFTFCNGWFEDRKLAQTQKKSGILLETLQGLPTLQGLDATAHRLNMWAQSVTDVVNANKPEQFLQSFLANFATFINLIVSVLVLFWGAYEVSEHHLTLGGLIAISILSARALAPVTSLAPVFSGYRQYKHSLNFVSKTLGSISSKEPRKKAGRHDITGALQLKEVSFSYPTQARKALENVSIDIPSGAKYGIIGASGAGKTTLIKFLAGDLRCDTPPDTGKIFWDSYLIDAVSPAQRAEVMGVSSQEDYFFSGTLAENVFIGVNERFRAEEGSDKEEHVKTVSFLSGLDLVMQQSGYGWDTQIAEGGTNLSTGARQSLSLARAMMKDPKILILDEPLNGLDHNLERRLITHLPKWLKGRTFIMVTHRTSLLPLVDHLVLMENGAVKAQGARDDMIKALST